MRNFVGTSLGSSPGPAPAVRQNEPAPAADLDMVHERLVVLYKGILAQRANLTGIVSRLYGSWPEPGQAVGGPETAPGGAVDALHARLNDIDGVKAGVDDLIERLQRLA